MEKKIKKILVLFNNDEPFEKSCLCLWESWEWLQAFRPEPYMYFCQDTQ